MASESEWRRACRGPIMTGILNGKARGLEGDKLKRHVSRHYCPFGARQHTPYKMWLSELMKAFGSDSRYYETPVVVASLARGTGLPVNWVGRIVGGERIAIDHFQSNVGVVVGSINQFPLARFDFHATDHPSIVEIADMLTATRLFDFSQVDLGSLETCL
jgi:hypothetical protein